MSIFQTVWRGKPLLLLYAGSPEEVRLLRAALRGLAEGAGRQLAIDELSFVQPIANCQLRAVSVKVGVGVSASPASAKFEWALDPESWLEVEELLEPYCEQSTGEAFQYLNRARGPEVVYSTERTW